MRLLAILTLLLTGCEAASAGSGLGALLRVEGAQWAPGAMADGGGPAVTSVRNARTAVWPGQRDKAITGTVARPASGVALMLEGDAGHWIVPAGAPDAVAPAELTFAARVSFSPALPLGEHALLVRAVDPGARFGLAWREPLRAEPVAPVAGALVFSLRWDTNADLDLHVVDPQGVEVWAGNINSYRAPPPGTAEDPEAWRRGGILDQDSNAGCRLDGRRQENVVWNEPPAGEYVVRVAAAALCGEVAARWTVEVVRAGEVAARAGGSFVDASTRGKQGAGAGILALAFSYP